MQEAVRAIEWAMTLQETRDVYLCLSAQRLANVRTSRAGKQYLLPIRSQENALTLKALFLDIDIKPGSGYPDVPSAVAALKNFLEQSKMPKPTMIVGSGGGMHVYWTMIRAIMPREWQPMADALAEATRRFGLKCDTVCTVDSARILRVPGTLNRKSDPPRPVRLVGKVLDFDYTVERLQEALAPFIKPPEQPILPPRAAPALPVPNELAAGIESKAEPVDLDLAAKSCPFIADAVTSGGKDYANPLWNLTTLLAVFTAGGRADAHRMANQHPGYTVESTDELFTRKERERESRGLGWPSCKSIQNAGCVQCGACPHKDENKTPFHFRQKPALPVPVKPSSDLPEGYVRDPSGVVCYPIATDGGGTVLIPVVDYPLVDPWMQKDPWILHFTATTHTGGKTRVALPSDVCNSKEGIPKELSKYGIVLHERQTKAAREFFVSWIKTLQKSKDSVVSSAPFGWNMRNGKVEGFVFGGNVWTPNGERPAAITDPVIAAQYHPTGEIKPWLDAAEMITSQGRPGLDAIIASSFGAPLVRFTGMEGCLLSLYSQESGIGKTTALKVAQSVWGDPVKAMQGLSDTQYSVVRKMSEIRSLPIYWDELKTDEDAKKFVQLTFQLTSGKEKTRLSSDITMRSVGTWQTLLCVASNESLVDHITSRTKMTTAGLYRIFEYEVTPGVTGQIDPSDAQRIIAKLNDNYGTVGLEYAKYLGEHHASLELEVADFEKKLGQEANIQNDERFWRSTISCVVMGARFANRLGLTNIDEARLKQFMLDTLGGMRTQRKETHVDMRSDMNVSNVLSQFFNQMRARHTLFTNKLHVSRGKPAAGAVQVKRAADKLDGIYVHVGLEDKLMRISLTYLGDWLSERGYSRHMFLRAMEQKFGCQKVTGRLGSGTEFVGGTEYLLQIDLAGTPLANFIEEA